MKSRVRARRQPKLSWKSGVVSLSNAKTYLGRLLEQASRGKVVYILRGQQRFILQEAPRIDPIPMRPPGYFASSYSKAEIREQNRLAKASVIRPPRDFE